VPRIMQTKYWLAVAAFAIASVALFLRIATFGEWASFMGVLFTLYSVADVTNTHLQQAKHIPPENQTA
jgi:uncharacterized membrane protein YhaH (DUF805 family)